MATISKTARKAVQAKLQRERAAALEASRKEDKIVDDHMRLVNQREAERVRKALRPNKLAMALAITRSVL